MKKRAVLLIAILFCVLGVPGGLLGWERRAPGPTREIRSQVQTVMSPLAQSVRWGAVQLSQGLEFVVTAGLVRRENEMLKERVSRLDTENKFLRETLSKYERLDKGAALGEIGNWHMLQAEVVAYGGRRWARSLVVRRDRSGRITVGDPVLHLKGLAGIVVSANKSLATVQLLSDPQSAVGVIVLPQRARGVVKGTGDPERLEIILEDSTISLQPGQQIITSGMQGSLYPRGLSVGTVGELKRNRFGQTIAEVRPTVAFGQIEEVLVLAVGQHKDTAALDKAEN